MLKYEAEVVREALLSALREFEELEAQHDWFTSPSISRIHKAINILDKDKNQNDHQSHH